MSDILYRTIGATDPAGKPRVYFTCHADDFEVIFEEICQDIFKTHQCAVFYKENMAKIPSDDRWKTDLDSCNLVVIPITRKLLITQNPTMEYELPYIKEKHIPVLPIVVERGVDYLYSHKDKFGELQYLTRISADSTEIAYEKKLKKYLESVLISDAMAQRIRDTFDAYIFLSYRKKDRKYANELMQIIHRNPACRNIAIWFDEFLVPGESFKKNIEKILNDSKLFALLVTPNLLEEPEGKPNYVMEHEYPAACERAMEIVPVEMEATDATQLKEKFLGLPETVSPEDEEGFRRLIDTLARISRSLSDDPEHNFLLGLAYLEGIDVEVNRELGVELVTKAAEGQLPEAMEKLSYMYERGENVPLDYKTAILWAEKFAQHNASTLGGGNLKTITSAEHLACLYDFNGEVRKSLELYESAYQARVESFGENNIDTVEALRVYALECTMAKQFRKALKLQEKCYELSCALRGENDTQTQLILCDIGLSKGALGEHKEALELHKRAYEAAGKAYGEGSIDTMIYANNIAVEYYNLKEYDLAIQTHNKVLEQYCAYYGPLHPNSLYVMRSLATEYYAKGDYEKSLMLDERAYQGLCETLGEAHPNTLATFAELPYTYFMLGKYEEYIACADRVYTAYMKEYGADDPDTLKKYNFLGAAYGKCGQYAKALEILKDAYKRDCVVFGKLAPETNKVLDNIAAIHKRTGHRILARILYRTAKRRTRKYYKR